MNITIVKLPDISQCNQMIYPIQIDEETDVYCVFKRMFRSDDVLLDMYVNEIAIDNMICGGVLLSSESRVSLPNPKVKFYYSAYCVDSDFTYETLNNMNLQKFYLQFERL